MQHILVNSVADLLLCGNEDEMKILETTISTTLRTNPRHRSAFKSVKKSHGNQVSVHIVIDYTDAWISNFAIKYLLKNEKVPETDSASGVETPFCRGNIFFVFLWVTEAVIIRCRIFALSHHRAPQLWLRIRF